MGVAGPITGRPSRYSFQQNRGRPPRGPQSSRILAGPRQQPFLGVR
jgi:hypothetical protein